MRFRKISVSLLGLCLGLSLLISCKNESKTEPTKEEKAPAISLKVPSFNRDSAFHYVEKQIAFGPRRPNTDPHIQCKDWLVAHFKQLGLTTQVQEFDAKAYFGEQMKGYNIIAQYKPKEEKRIVISAHWDTRFKAEKDQDPNKKDQPIPGADDGGSGVAAIMEIARILSTDDIPLGVDFILFDLEDQGENGNNDIRSWCLGSQYWSQNPHISKFKFGINLDMIASKGAQFKKEGFSRRYAPGVVNKVWTWAKRLGYSNHFSNANGPPITDDHYFVNQAGIGPMINIIYTTNEFGGTFGAHWHTHDDDLDNIDKNVLKAVGQVVTNVLYKEAEGKL